MVSFDFHNLVWCVGELNFPFRNGTGLEKPCCLCSCAEFEMQGGNPVMAGNVQLSIQQEWTCDKRLLVCLQKRGFTYRVERPRAQPGLGVSQSGT